MTNNAANLLRLDWMGANEGWPYIEQAAASSITATLSWTEGDDTHAIAETSSSSAAISWEEAGDIAAAVIASASASSLAWTEEGETIAITATAGTVTSGSEWIITARRRGRR